MLYRREIDGLRAVAVVPVILFHAGFEVFSGGFVGVDVFFVISGYLITSIIIAEISQDRFSIVRFYERRARRILPALFAVMICCIPFAWMWMVPAQYKDFSQSLVAVSLFASNILFWYKDDYFAPASEEMPLLHTWSLAVEEQYYLFFPLLLMGLWRFGRNPVFYVILVLALLSLLLSEWGWRNAPSANFYLIPSRMWELFAGSICAFLSFGKQQRSNGVMAAAGLGLILLSIFYFDENTPFPSLYALAPVVGTVLVILYGATGTWTAKLLSTRLFVGIGLVSYSAYLWHQPLFAFERIRSSSEPSEWMMLALSLASIILACVSWKFIEQPFRKRPDPVFSDRRALFSASAAGAAVFIAFGAYGHTQNGFISRFEYAREFITHFENEAPDWGYFTRTNMLEHYNDECNFFNWDRFDVASTAKVPERSIKESCTTRQEQFENAVLIWGDSHAQMVYYGLKENLPQSWQILQVATSGCGPTAHYLDDHRKNCQRSNKAAMDSIAASDPNVVIISQRDEFDFAELDAIVETLKKKDVDRIIIMGPSPRWSIDLPWVIVRKWEEIPARTWYGVNPEYFEYDQELKQHLADTEGVEFVSILDEFCDEAGCLTYLDDDVKTGITTWDYGHLTPIASSFLAKRRLLDAVLN